MTYGFTLRSPCVDPLRLFCFVLFCCHVCLSILFLLLLRGLTSFASEVSRHAMPASGHCLSGRIFHASRFELPAPPPPSPPLPSSSARGVVWSVGVRMCGVCVCLCMFVSTMLANFCLWSLREAVRRGGSTRPTGRRPLHGSLARIKMALLA